MSLIGDPVKILLKSHSNFISPHSLLLLAGHSIHYIITIIVFFRRPSPHPITALFWCESGRFCLCVMESAFDFDKIFLYLSFFVSPAGAFRATTRYAHVSSEACHRLTRAALSLQGLNPRYVWDIVNQNHDEPLRSSEMVVMCSRRTVNTSPRLYISGIFEHFCNG